MGRQNYEIEWQTISIRSIKIFLLLVVAIAGFLLYWFRLKDATMKTVEDAVTASESAARFMDYEGKVEVKPRDEFVWKEASFKMDLHEGDRIRTAPDSSARIKFEDGTEITVQPDSIVVINKRNSGGQEQPSSLMVIEIGGSDVNAEKSSSAPSVSTEKITQFKLAPGSTGSVEADQQTGEHSSMVDKGYGESTIGGQTIKQTELERVEVGRTNEIKKIRLPSTPPLYSPQNGQVFDFLSDQGLTIELKWRDVPNAERYHVQISETMLFAKLKGENARLTKSSIAIKIPKTSKKQYFWRVRSIDKNNNASPWSNPYQFVVQTPVKDKDRGPNTDKTPPVLKITYMHPFLPFIQVEGKTEPDAFLTLNGEVIDVKEDGTFVYTYTLKKSGVNDLVFVAEDPAGNQSTEKRTVEY